MMHQLRCAEVWGGIQNQDLDARSAAIVTSLYSASCEGGKGGDIYYLSVCQGDMLTRVAIADVLGHGEGVSRVSQWLYEGLQQRMNAGNGCEILVDLNRLTAERGLEALTTAAVISFYKPDAAMCFSYAGHHPMLMRPRGGSGWQAVLIEAPVSGPANLPLGIDPEMRYEQRLVPVQAGDRVFLYTDGVIEAPSPDGDFFGTERLVNVLDQAGKKSLPELKLAVRTALLEHVGHEPTHDDVTLLAIELR
jgi:sigma-B regulation protein RsbU (phosphoserine phosphatase)